MDKIFTRLLECKFPDQVESDPSTGKNRSFAITIIADGEIPFPQIIFRTGQEQKLINGSSIRRDANGKYISKIPSGFIGIGTCPVQIEGCRVADISRAAPADWIKWFGNLSVLQPDNPKPVVSITQHKANGNVKLYFGIHKHMHQPYYQAADKSYWDGEKDQIFGTRCGPYTGFIPDAVRQYIEGGLEHAGLSTSWSGSLIEQLIRCDHEHLCGGCFTGWNKPLAEIAGQKTVLGNQRVAFTAFGFFHPLMPLMPGRDIIKQINRHAFIVKETFGVEASATLFPPETAFHVRMIPALLKAGVKAVIYDSIHRFRSCKEYPYAGLSEGMLPPSPAEQENPPVNDWMQLNNIWAGSKISPSLLKPEYVRYEDVDGRVYKILAIPAERYIGNEDARGGFGALLYPQILGQVYDNIVSNDNFDSRHPPFFLLHSDGDNYGGGADSYYNHNTGMLVEWIKNDPRFELTTIDDYLMRFPPDEEKTVHIEPGAWSGADNGDPQFRKWFSRYNEPYSPDLNSWAVLTALENAVHSVEDLNNGSSTLPAAQRLLLTAQTSCYWYWTGQDVWDFQVTHAANAALGLLRADIDILLSLGKDITGPTIFAPWITPENPGGKTWGQGCLRDADKTGTVHTFIYDITGLNRVTLVLRTNGVEKRMAMKSCGVYPSRTNALASAEYFTCQLPVAAGDLRYYIEAEDKNRNISISALERAFCG